MPHITLVTSLYRTEAHLPTYIRRADALFAALNQAGLTLQIILVANDATFQERDLLEPFAARYPHQIRLMQVPRESVYASWNRGFEQADAPLMGPWNVDDERLATGLIAAHEKFQDGAALLDAPYAIEHNDTKTQQPVEYQSDCISPKCGVGPFFLFSKILYEQAGAFNPNFRIAGDFEWSKRPIVREAAYAPMTELGGIFQLHDDNLSGGHSPREWVEFNIALLWHSNQPQLRPVEPNLMLEAWEAWGHTGAELSAEQQDWLWGTEAQDRYMQYTRERQANPLARRVRLALARRGLWQSVEWDVHHGK